MGEEVQTIETPNIVMGLASGVNFKGLVVISCAFVALYMFFALLSKKPLKDYVKDVVVLIFNLYGIGVCFNVIVKAWKYKYSYHFIVYADNIKPDMISPSEMGMDEMVLIFIGSVGVALILSEQVILIIRGPIDTFIANRFGKNSVRSDSDK